ncbi:MULTISPECIES: metal-sulfur cluster assembly factor [Arcobacter]|jgi:metal-sulfur cluster biosynthetic enzyme|uniref:FeS assembly SUF system protein n=1 Tax=Arcobacter ellisii TaxID=913109 RepID=A0A347U6H1_9BACT|nr:metal-sulfur cluster assembly factor [Arcobacter ellisii]AXX94449.1 [Fe-S] cluster assembly protein [Arcobacter ellisii]RXI31147.1 FeS assembly SUF system protein [Arcobacter ellisii]
MSKIFDLEKIKEKVIENLKKVYDPEIPADIYNLGLIYEIKFEEKENYLYCEIDMTLTSPACPVADSLLEQVKYVTLAVDEIDEVRVNLVFNPVWDPSMMSEDAREIMGASGAAIPFY